jgi:hypothetical protein
MARLGQEQAYELFVVGEQCSIDQSVPMATALLLFSDSSIKLRLHMTTDAQQLYGQAEHILAIDKIYIYLACNQLTFVNTLPQSQFVVNRTDYQEVALFDQDLVLLLGSGSSDDDTATLQVTPIAPLPTACILDQGGVFVGLHVSFVMLE